LIHPIFIPLFGALIYLFGSESYLEPFAKYLLLSQIILVTIFIPGTILFFLKAMGKVDSIMVSETSQRKIPMLIQILLMLLLLSKSVTFDTVPELFFFYLGGVFSAILAFVFLFSNVKASIHTLGISSLTVFCMALSIHNNTNWIYEIAVLVLLNGVVTSSRIMMNAHSSKELLLGFALGIFPQIALLRFWL
jgi:hypothetical protein